MRARTPSRHMRLTAYTDATGVGGGEISLSHLVGGLRPDIEVTVLGVDSGVVETVAAGRPGTSWRLLPVIDGPGHLRAVAAHATAIARSRPDVLHVNLRVPTAAAYAVLTGLALPRCRVVAVEQLPIRPDSRLSGWLKRRTSARLDAHVCVARGSAVDLERVTGVPRHTLRWVHNGVPDAPVAAPCAAPAAAHPLLATAPDGTRRPVVGSLGRLDPQKGYDVLLEALASLPAVEVVLVGDGPARADLAGQARRLGVEERVTVTGWSPRPRMWLSGFDVFVLPSRSEGFPLAVVEAMLAGLPVVATSVGGVPEAVVEGSTGLLVGKDDPEALAAALHRLLADASLRRAMGHRGRQRALGAFTAEHMCRGFEAIYDEVAGG